jgi:hypothetical protein
MNIMCKSNNLTMPLLPIRSQQMSFAHVKWSTSKQQSYTCSSWQCIVGWCPKQRHYSFRQRKMIILTHNVFTSCPLPFLCHVESNGVDPMIKEQHKVVWIFHLDIHRHGSVAYTLARTTVFEMKKVNSVLCERGGEQIIEVVDVFECILSTHLLSADHSKWTRAFRSPVYKQHTHTHTHTHKSEQLLTYETNLKPEMQG